MSGSIQDILSVKELQEWLHERVADDDDIVIDDLQEDFNEQFEKEDEKNGIKVWACRSWLRPTWLTQIISGL